ncbi:reverse transcriptase domain-containing protein [Tanacetum coccineum]
MLILSLIGKNVTSWSKKELCLEQGGLANDLKYDKSKIRHNRKNFHARSISKLLEKDTPFEFDDECQKAFGLLKEKLTCAPVITVKDNPAIWSRKLDDALWAFRTSYKTPTGTTPYKLIYGKNFHLPFEVEHRAYWALKNCNPDLIAAGEKRMFQLH